MLTFQDVFPQSKPLIACIHLMALPGAPLYGGDLKAIYRRAVEEAEIFQRAGVDGLIIENFMDVPFFPDRVPSETIAVMAGVAREVRRAVSIPIGINVLRNDADAALSVAIAAEAQFIRVNVHNGAMLTDQGIVQGQAYLTARKRAALGADVLVFADVAVKHAAQIAELGLDIQARDLAKRSLADALIVSGSGTGAATEMKDLDLVAKSVDLPVLIGSGTTPANLRALRSLAGGFIVGSYFKREGIAQNEVQESRVQDFVQVFKAIS